MASTYQQTTEQEIQDRVRVKYKSHIDQLRALHFEELCFVDECMPALGLSNGLLGVLGVLIALPFEVSRVRSDLSASIFSILMVSREYDTYANPFGLGIKFYTSFTDGTCLITANFAGQPINDDREKLYKFVQPGSIAAAWQHHLTRINDLTAKGKQRKYQLSFDDYTRLTRQEDRYMLKSIPFTGGFTDPGSMFLSTIMFVCLMVAAILFFMVFPNIVHTLYPACEYAKALGKPVLPLGFLIASACVIFSWLLARVQKNIFTMHGIGTALHGHSPSPTARGYIATRWLMFMSLPLLPVRSYQIDAESSGDPKPSPIPDLHWEQIWETIWKFKWRYALLVLFWIGLGVWTLLKCI